MSERPIELTPKAVAMAKQKLSEADEPVLGLRVGVKGSGCNGFTYVIEFAKKIRESKDLALDFDGLTVVVDHKSLAYLEGSTLDWQSKLMSYGFQWNNPNATSLCGCGESFDVKKK